MSVCSSWCLCSCPVSAVNDLIFLLDEGLKQLSQIRELQVEMENEAQWSSQPSDTRQERERGFTQSEQGATSCLTLANATVHMLFYLTAEVVSPFVAPEFVGQLQSAHLQSSFEATNRFLMHVSLFSSHLAERMAHMLDLYIMQLVGPKISELKVKNREKYAFKPRDLLQEIIGIWLHLAHEPEFLNKVASDERSVRWTCLVCAILSVGQLDILTVSICASAMCSVLIVILCSPRPVVSCAIVRSWPSVPSFVSSISTAKWSS
jgi:hypothetical protein